MVSLIAFTRKDSEVIPFTIAVFFKFRTLLNNTALFRYFNVVLSKQKRLQMHFGGSVTLSTLNKFKEKLLYVFSVR